MKLNNQSFIDIEDAIKNFSHITNIVEKKGDVVIIENNNPKYVISLYEKNNKADIKEKINSLSKDILIKNLDAFREMSI